MKLFIFQFIFIFSSCNTGLRVQFFLQQHVILQRESYIRRPQFRKENPLNVLHGFRTCSTSGRQREVRVRIFLVCREPPPHSAWHHEWRRCITQSTVWVVVDTGRRKRLSPGPVSLAPCIPRVSATTMLCVIFYHFFMCFLPPLFSHDSPSPPLFCKDSKRKLLT